MIAAPAGGNAVSINGEPVSPEDFVDDIETGFREMYEHLIRLRQSLLGDGSPLEAMRHQRVRFLFRGTGVYYAVLERANRPECLRDGAMRSIELDAFCRAQVLETGKPTFWPIVRAERLSMERGGIPYFLVSASSTDLELPSHQCIDDCFVESCFDGMQARLRRLDERDLRPQLSYIRATMQARVARHGNVRLEENDAPTSGAPVRVGREELTHEAVRIAQQIREDALGDISSGVVWMTVRFDFSMQRFRLEVSGPGLYDGGVSIALFLSSLEKVTGGAGMRDLAMASVYPLRAILRDSDSARPGKEFGIGVAQGLALSSTGLPGAGCTSTTRVSCTMRDGQRF